MGRSLDRCSDAKVEKEMCRKIDERPIVRDDRLGVDTGELASILEQSQW